MQDTSCTTEICAPIINNTPPGNFVTTNLFTHSFVKHFRDVKSAVVLESSVAETT